jgi:hypothetical protein
MEIPVGQTRLELSQEGDHVPLALTIDGRLKWYDWMSATMMPENNRVLPRGV